ncbi:MAG: hypothetical protein K8T90_20610 [Planctomycetes bacterium]|nr:hypothetical protein [Planctomycetota bacterium]
MSDIATALANELLQQHAHFCAPGRFPDACVVTYGDLCERAGCPEVTRGVGQFLGEVAAWCGENGYPPLNALAVNQDSRMPGDSYDVAVNCSLLGWPNEVRACIDFRGYPAHV